MTRIVPAGIDRRALLKSSVAASAAPRSARTASGSVVVMAAICVLPSPATGCNATGFNKQLKRS